MAEGETTFTFKGDTKPAEKALDDFGDKVLGIGKKVGVAFAAYFSAQAISSALSKAVDSAMEAEKAVLQFNSALALSGQFSESAAAGFEAFASSLERTTGVEDELILSNAALLVSIGKLSGEGLERATKAALDLSRGMQVDVGTAFDIVTKATQGNVMALSRYGLEVNKTDTDAQKFAKTLQFIESRFGGLSTGAINTFEGALTKLRNGYNDIFESAGKLITSSPKVIATISVLGDVFYNISSAIGSSSVNLGKFVDALFNIGQFLLTFVIAPIETLVRWMITTSMMIPNLMLTLYTNLAAVSDKLFGTNLEAKIAPIKQMMIDLQMAAATPLFTDEQLFTTRLSNGLDKTKAKVDELAESIKVKLPQAVTTATDQAAPQVESFSTGFIDALKNMSKSTTELGKTVASTFVSGMTNAFSAVGKALIEGGNAFGAFGKAVLMMLGNIALQMGSFYIAAGIAAMFLNPAQGAGMIAAGAGLSVLGGVLQALGSGGGAPAPATGAVGGAGTMPANPVYTSPMAEETTEEERAKAQTGVQVIVQGNIFDSRETGLQIAQIINDSFDLNGTIIRANA